MKTNHTPTGSSQLAATLTIALLLASCGGKHDQEENHAGAIDSSGTQVEQQKLLIGTAGDLDSAVWFYKSAPKDYITATELKGYQKDFQDHFYFRYKNSQGQDVDMPLLNTRREIRWDKFKALFEKHLPAAVAVMISYGQAESSFVPVFEFCQLDGAGLKVIPNSAYIYEDAKADFYQLQPPGTGMPERRVQLTDAYSNNVKVIRKAGVPVSNLVKGTDPHAILFPWNTKFDALMTANPVVDNRIIVLSCIAAEAELTAGGGVEFRHGLAAYVAQYKDAQGAVVLFDGLSDSPMFSGGAPTYYRVAMDLGTLCPPNCPK